MQPKTWLIGLIVCVAPLFAHESQSRTCEASAGMFSVPPGPAVTATDRLEGTLWFLRTSVFNELTEAEPNALVTIEIVHLKDPDLRADSQTVPLPSNGVVSVQWTRGQLDEKFGGNSVKFGAIVRLTTSRLLKKPVLFKPGDDFPEEMVVLTYSRIQWTYIQRTPDGKEEGAAKEAFGGRPSECKS